MLMSGVVAKWRLPCQAEYMRSPSTLEAEIVNDPQADLMNHFSVRTTHWTLTDPHHTPQQTAEQPVQAQTE